MSARALPLLAVASCLLGRTGAQQCTPDVLSEYPSGWPTQLDVGIYWFGYNDQFEKAEAGQKSLFYDPSKPTLLYFHGWSGEHGGSVSKCQRLTTRCPAEMCPEGAGSVELAKSWLDLGWNVGFFYWDQFADEECQRDAEQKIWFNKDGKGIKWKSYEVAAGTEAWLRYEGAQLSLGELAAATVKEAMADFAGGQVRFVAHDVGAQLAAHAASLLHVENHRAAPTRLALLEPFFTRYHLKFLRCKELNTAASRGIGDFAEEATTEAVEILLKTKGVVTEVYKSSPLTEKAAFGLTSKDLSRLATLVIYDPTWCGSLGGAASLPETAQSVLKEMGQGPNLACYHTAIIPLYFLHVGLPASALSNALPPGLASQAATGSALRGCPTPFAGCKDGELREWISRQNASGVAGAQIWRQRAGMATFSLADDAFELSPDVSVDPAPILRDAAPLAAAAAADEEGAVVELLGGIAPTKAILLRGFAIAGVLCCLVAWLSVARCYASAAAEDDDGELSDASGGTFKSAGVAEHGQAGLLSAGR